MRITEFSLRNPLVIAAITIAMLAFGLSSYLSMGVGITPNVSFPLVLVTTTDAGADPSTVETQVTKPIEDAVATLQNIDTMTSTSTEGVSSVAIQFTTEANSALVPVDVERVVNSIRGQLPAEADPPSISKLETSAFPVITVAASGPQSLDEIQSVAKDRINRAFEAVPGVQSVSISGGEDREIQVKVDPNKLEAYGIGLNTVQQALQAEQIQTPAGLLTANGKDVNVRLNGLVTQPDQLRQIIITTTPSGPVYVKDVATVSDAFKKTRVINRLNGVPAVTLTATKAVSANTLAVSKGIRQAIADLQPTLPKGMKLDVVTDAATYTQQSFDTIQRTMIEAVLFTGLILLIFLHTWRSTLIVLVSIPTSLFTTFAMMGILGQNLNLFSMLALTLSVGILVDDSIVVLENIYRHLGLNEPPILAAINGRSEIGLAAITITMVDVVVYVPIALISGIAGDFIRPFALVVAAATLTSLVVSFTLAPLLAGRFLTHDTATDEGKGLLAAFGRWWNRGFDRVGNGYRWLLSLVLHGKLLKFGFIRSGVLALTGQRVGHRIPTSIGARWGVIVIGLLAFVAGIGLFVGGSIGIDVFPSGDQSEVDVSLTMPPATTLGLTSSVIQTMEGKVKTFPEVRGFYSNVGGGGGGGFGEASSGDTGRVTVLLVPGTERTRSSAQLADEFRKTLDPGIPGARLNVSLPNAFGFGGFGSQPIQIAVRGSDPVTLNRLVDQVTSEVKQVPGAVEVTNANEKSQPEYVVNVNRDSAADLGVSSQAAAGTLRAAVDGVVVSKYRRAGQDDVDIRVMTDDSFRASPDNLAALPILSSNGTIVHLGQIGTIITGSAPTQIAHVNRERSVTVSASNSGQTVGSVSQAVQARLSRLTLPPGYAITYQGQAAMGASAFSDIFRALGIALLLMYILMMMLFGSVTLPLAVLTSLPLAIVGALGALALTHNSFTLFSLLGVAMLVGLVGKNAILLVDFTDSLRKRGYTRTDALLQAGPTRLRPIVMTTMSIFVSLAPLALGAEAGSEILKASALVLIGGLLTSTLLTLVFVPAMYTIFDDIQEFVIRLVNRIAHPRSLLPEELAALKPRLGSSPNGSNPSLTSLPNPMVGER